MVLKYYLTNVEIYIVQYKQNTCRGFGAFYLYLRLLVSKLSQFNNITKLAVVINN